MEIKKLIQIFLYELEEEGREFYNNLQKLEEKFKNNVSDIQPYLDEIFISVHTLKGSANTLLNSVRKQQHPLETLLSSMAKLTHHFEDYIDFLKTNSNNLAQKNIDILFEFDNILSRIYNSLQTEEKTVDQTEIVSFLDKISSFSHNEVSIIEKQENKNKTRHFFELSLSCDDEQKHGYLSLVYRDIEKVYEESYFTPTKEMLLKGEEFTTIALQIVSDKQTHTIKNFIETIPCVDKVIIIPYKSNFSLPTKKEDNKPAQETINNDKIMPYKNKNSQPLRLDPKRIDNVLKHTSKLVILGNKIDEFLNQSNFLAGTKKRKELEAIFDEINLTIDFLQTSVLEIRMTPFEELLSLFPRDIRTLSQKYNKPINFKTIGQSTEIDKAILDELSEPFIHLIRNSIIHGIEPPKERVEQGKSEKGNITIHAKHDKNRVLINIIDDGRGIDIQSLKEVALRKKYISEEQYSNLKDDDVLNLIFKPGVTSTEKVDEYSGRGMGMEAVRKKIEELNGSMSIHTKQGLGTNITISLPLTTAIIEGMITKINNEFFTFPIIQVEEVINIKKDEIKTSSGQEYIFLNDKEIPLIFSKEYFGYKNEVQKNTNNPFVKVMILNSQNQIIGLTIDEYLGQQSIVVKNLHPLINYSPGIGSCHVLGDGSISLIVDSNELYNYFNR